MPKVSFDNPITAAGYGQKTVPDAWLERIQSLTDSLTDWIALDIGCGSGFHARCLYHMGAKKAIGLDFSLETLKLARKEDKTRLLTVIQADALHLPLRKYAVNFVLMRTLVHHLTNHRQAIQEAGRVLAPGGKLLIQTIAPKQIAQRLIHQVCPEYVMRDVIRWPNIDYLCNLLEDAHFSHVWTEEFVDIRKPESTQEFIERVRTRRSDSILYMLTKKEHAHLLTKLMHDLPNHFPNGLVLRTIVWTFIIAEKQRC